MHIVKRTSRVADILLSVLTTFVALVLLFTSGYILYDNFYKGQHAFVSRDLLQFKPSSDNTPAMSFRMIREINPDTVAWLTVYGTNIDYPVVQGKDDLEYASKDIYGNQSLTGAIYLSSNNSSNLGDRYNLIYGHHMDNGAMFGDIDKFADREFFMTHRSGLITTPEGNFDLNIFACLSTDAYDNLIYYIGGHDADTMPALISYIGENAVNYTEINANSITKIVALSTCADAATNGRMVLFANATPRMLPIEASDSDATPALISRIAQGHGTSAKGWSLLNLVCVIATFLTLLPVTFLRKKFGQFSYAKAKLSDIDDTLKGLREIEKAVVVGVSCGGIDPLELTEKCVTDHREVYNGLKRFYRKALIGLLLEALAATAAVVAFVMTENIYLPMTIRDEYTGLMVGIFALSLVIDYIFLRYRGARPEKLTYSYAERDRLPEPA